MPQQPQTSPVVTRSYSQGYTSDSDDDPNEAAFRPRREASIRARAVIASACGIRHIERTTTRPSRHVKREVEDDEPEIVNVESFFEVAFSTEPPNNSLSNLPTTNTAQTARTQKRQREVFECVLIPRSKAFKRPKTENNGEVTITWDASPASLSNSDTEEDFKKKMELWENSKVKKKKNNPVLLAETIRTRLRHIGFDVSEQYFEIDKLMREVMVTRAFMSNVYGGSSQETFPSPHATRIAEHGIDDFMFLNTNFQPQAPEVPGAPGLWFSPNNTGNHGIRRVFTKINMAKPNNKWLYVGQYDVRVANPSRFSVQEWRAQPAALQNTWADAIANQGWGTPVCARILGRKLYGREPDDDECQQLDSSGRYREVTADEVNAAYHSGKELMVVWTMKCVGYDNKFQTDISRAYPMWVPPPPKTKSRGRKGS
ncbi:hypothetical protein D9619_009280 [Psilocybe cf. subviscida]|uniref:DUF6697 domain-containing protein n=1 Tax=Psilocybe cf. subviscida TaxID=2480587 RepID=A0A8H5BUG7_9AGAR|nr:hypothetical protein D9619_009280 [Psilocybe cf. subviscida]